MGLFDSVIKVRCSNLYCTSNNLIVSIQKADLNSEKCTHCNSKYMETSRSNPSPDVLNQKKFEEEKKKKFEEEKKNNIRVSTGSGFFVSDKGHIVTNFHVINDSNSIKFIYNDDEIDARITFNFMES